MNNVRVTDLQRTGPVQNFGGTVRPLLLFMALTIQSHSRHVIYRYFINMEGAVITN